MPAATSTQGARPRKLPPANPASLAYSHFHRLRSPACHQITEDPTLSGCLLGCM